MELDDVIVSFKTDPTSSAFVLDYDGSLSPIVEQPESARPAPGAVEVLRALASRYFLVAILSGRKCSDLIEMLGSFPTIRYLGIYGAEEVKEGRIVRPAEAERWRGMASRLARDAEAFIAVEGLQGCWVEYKDIAVSVHFRAASSERAGESILAWAEHSAARRGFAAEPGRKVVEMRPLGVSKSAALERLLQGVALNNLFVAGDDVADAKAMERARLLAMQTCLTVGVGSNESPEALRLAARFMVAGPQDLVQLLGRFV